MICDDNINEELENCRKLNNHALSGEIKLALTLQMLSGASYLDLLLSYNISVTSIYDAFEEVLTWINAIFNFPLRQWIETENLEAL